MSYYGIYGSYRTGGTTSTSHGITSQNSNTLHTNSPLSHKDRSPGRSSSQYLSPYPRSWQSSKKSLSPKRYSTAEHAPSHQHSTDRSSRYTDYHSPSMYGWTKDVRRSLSPCYGDYSYLHGRDRSPGHRSQKPRVFLPSRNTVWTDLSLRFPKTLRYSGKVGDGYRRSDVTYNGTYDRPRVSELSGWRAKLAQQGYVATTSKKVCRPCLPERKWQYLDEQEVEEEETGFEFRTSCGTHPESDEQQHESVISRTKRMKLQKCTENPIVAEIAVQVDPVDLQKYKEQEERRVNRSFISSRHHSWYDSVPISYKKYLSPMPWRGSGNYSTTRSSRNDNEETKDSSPVPEQAETNKDFRKSALNVDLPHTEAQLFAQRQAETRWRRTVDDNYYTSEDGSPSETGYDSSYTDADRSSGDTEGFFTDSLDRSYTFGTSYRSSQRSTPFGDDGHFFESVPSAEGPFEEFDQQQIQMLTEQFVDSTDLNSDLDTEGCSDAVPHGDIIAENLCFRFKSLNEESSQRDSGFSEIYNQCDSPGISIPPDQDTEQEQQYDKGMKEVFISGCYDIDQLLTDKDLDYTAFQTFEDFDRMIERHKSNVRSLSCEDGLTYCKPRWSKPAKTGLKLDLEACSKFIGTCHDIDEMLGVPTPLSPDSEASFAQEKMVSSTIPEEEEGDGVSTAATSIIGCSDIADLTWLSDQDSVIEHSGLKKIQEWSPSSHQGKLLDDCTLQLYRYNGSEGDYGNYLDPESTIDEQAEDFEDFHQNRKNAIILRTQLSVRVHAIIEKLLNSTGRELRRALFSLKQIFQDDKDLVHEFVQNDGLACLIKVGSEADQNYQNYILRALGQVMLYVDGMNGVIEHIETIQWLYSLISSKYRLVVKTALKLLLVFVEYSDSNSQLLMNTVCVVDSEKGTTPWSNIMNLLKEKDSADMELLVYAVTLINKTLNGIPDQDTYYDIVDHLEEQGMENIIQYYMSKQGTDLDLLSQFQIYEAVLKHEDGVPDTKPLPLDGRFRQIPRSRKSLSDDNDRRKSRRHSVGTVSNGDTAKPLKFHSRSLENTPEESPFNWQDRNQNHIDPKKNNQMNGHVNGNGVAEINGHEFNGITPSLRRRRERAARNKSLIKEQEENSRNNAFYRSDSLSSSSSMLSDESLVKEEPKTYNSLVDRHRSRFENHVDLENRKNNEITKQKEEKFKEERNNDSSRPSTLPYNGLGSNNHKKSWMLSMMYGKSQDEEGKQSDSNLSNGVEIVNNNYIVYNKSKDETITSNCNLNNLKRDSSVKDMQEKFIYRNGDSGVRSPTFSDNMPRIGDPSGIISRAKEGLASSKTPSKPTSPLSPSSSFVQEMSKKPDSDVQWEQLIKSVKRPLVINDLDFTDLRSEEDIDFLECLEPEVGSDLNGGPPPPPLPPGLGPPPPPPPLPLGGGLIAPPPPPQMLNNKLAPRVNGSMAPTWMKRNQQNGQDSPTKDQQKSNGKTKKTVKLFWREVKEDKSLLKRIGKKKTIWDELKPVPVDTQKLEHLFENRAKELVNKEKSQETIRKSAIIVLDTKRSNAINIGMTKLPPPRTIKTAILKMDSTIMNREGIEKILTMLPTEDEKTRIAEAQMANPDVPLGTAEQFLLTLSSISELEARLRLWAFRLDYETLEREVAEPLMDLKQAIKEIESSETFRVILSTLRSVGNFLNGVEIKGFHIEYLSKVPEVKDTVQKHSLLHHLCHIVMEKFPKSCDLYSEIGSVTRASKIDYGEVTKSLNKMESECKASWDYLKAILKHDCNITLKVRTTEFLTDCAERIIVLKVIHRRMINRYHKFLVYLGCTSQSIEELPIQRCCRILSEFALEYRTTRERVLQQIEKKANHRERNKTRGKLITDMDRFKTKEQQADHELRQLLGNSNSGGGGPNEEHKTQKWGTVPGTRGRVRSQLGPGGSLGRHSAPGKEEADDEILESLVKTATTQPARNEPRIRKKARYGDRKSLRRTLKGGLELSEEERNILSTMTT